jgi:ribosomal protein S18 acetylase RimI-like enzyme
MSITINHLTPHSVVNADILAICQCNDRNLPISYNCFDYLTMINSANHIVVVASIKFNKGQIVGYIVGKVDNKNCNILSFGVDKEFRRMKIGTKLMKYIENKANEVCNTLSLFVHLDNNIGIKFYKNLGFKIKEHVINYYEGNIKDVATQDAYVMIMKI